MVLYMIGLGLYDEKDVSCRGLEIIKNCDYVYLEYYTSKLTCSLADLETFYGKKVILADRELVEIKSDEEILPKAKEGNVAFLVIGDVFGATTHTDIMLRAKDKGIAVRVINNASVLTAVGITGLELYKFGKVTSIPFNNKDITTPVDVFNKNKEVGFHTLFLLDLDPLNDKFMKISEAAVFLESKGVDSTLLAVGCAGLGTESPEIVTGTVESMKNANFTKFPQCLIIPGNLHFVEEEALEIYR